MLKEILKANTVTKEGMCYLDSHILEFGQLLKINPD